MTLRILFLGDIVGKPGVGIVRAAVPVLRQRERLDCVIANAENAVNGSGLLPNTYQQLRQAGVDAVTMGDHIYKKTDLIPTLRADPRICKPANFPPTAPGRDWVLVPTAQGSNVGVFSVLGRTFMRAVDCPFLAADRVLTALASQAKCIVVDVHAEATADKYLLGHYLNGRVSAVLGTHTHVPTADEHVLPGGTAFQCDVGMTGPHASILGRDVEPVLAAALTFLPKPFTVAQDDVRLNGAIVEVDPTTGQAIGIRRVQYTGAEVRSWSADAPE